MQSHGSYSWYIATGQKGALFTLRKKGVWHVCPGQSQSWDNYEYNLHTDDLSVAYDKAKKIIAKDDPTYSGSIQVEAMASGFERGAKATHKINFGKYQGTLLTDIPTDYLVWISRNCEKKLGKKRMAYIKSLPNYIEEIERIEADLKRREEEKEARQKKLEEDKALSSWIGEQGEKIELENCEIVFSNDFDNQFGQSVLVIAKHGNNKVKFFSTAKNAWQILRNFREDKVVNVTLKGTIKNHDEYKDEKSTMLNRVKVTFLEEVE